MIPVVVEGDADVPIAEQLLTLVGFELGPVYGLSGKGGLDKRLKAYNAAAHHAHWLTLRDLDTDASCAPELIRELLPRPARLMCLRIAVRGCEAWLLADRDRMADYLHVPLHHVPANPDTLRNPKLELVNLARRSRSKTIREEMTPAPETSGIVGPGYTTRVIEFATTHWRPRTAAHVSTSLARTIEAVERWAALKAN